MTSRNAEHRIEKCGTTPESSWRNRRGYGAGAQGVTAKREHSCSAANLMEAVVEGSNMRRAFARVVANKGAAGADKMPVDELGSHPRAHWPRIEEDGDPAGCLGGA